MLPGFVDRHGHVVMGGIQALSAKLLAPPDGDVTDITGLQEVLRQWVEDDAEVVKQVNLIVGSGYDNAQLAELRHPAREELAAADRIPAPLLSTAHDVQPSAAPVTVHTSRPDLTTIGEPASCGWKALSCPHSSARASAAGRTAVGARRRRR